jgi:uncharacterized membrane protein YbaN (DUF454 family)
VKKVYRHFFGWFFIVLGIIGLFLPVLQGILFLVIGTIILAPAVPFFSRILVKLEKKYPDIFAQAKRFLHRVSCWKKNSAASDPDTQKDKEVMIHGEERK